MHALVLLALGWGCKKDQADTGDTGGTADQTCAELGLPARPFDPTGPTAWQRGQPAGDVSLPLKDGSIWTLSQHSSGCESVLFLPQGLAIDGADPTSWWTTGLDELLARSPRNVHYVFVVTGADDPDGLGDAQQAEVEAVLATLGAADAAWWGSRLHVVDGASDQVGGLVGEMFSRPIGAAGFAIDRFQQIQTLGHMSDVEAYDNALALAGEWPFERRLYSAAYEAQGLNQAWSLQQDLDAEAATVLTVLDHVQDDHSVEGSLSLPDATTMAGFDTLILEVGLDCPDPDEQELGNCGTWAYDLAVELPDPVQLTAWPVARLITPYQRGGHWAVDASHALAWLKEGGERSLRVTWGPTGGVQPTVVTLRARLSNRGKGGHPDEVIPLFSGGALGPTYNDDRPPIPVDIPGDVTRVELVTILSGHDTQTGGCAADCVQAHTFTVGSQQWVQTFDQAGSETACRDQVGQGARPTQGGSWWYGHAGWCAGQQVDPVTIDVTAAAPAGSSVEVGYQVEVPGVTWTDTMGTINLSSFLVLVR